MKKIFKTYLDLFIIFFIDAILICSKNEEDYSSHFRFVLQNLKDKDARANHSKCEFLLEFVVFLVHIISGDGIRVYTKK